MTKTTASDVERIVGEVLRRLRQDDAGHDAHERAAAEKSQENSATVTIAERVVSLAALEGRLAGVDKVLVSGDAVVTPAAGDELRRRKITLEIKRKETVKQQSQRPIVAASTVVAPTLLAVVDREGGDVTRAVCSETVAAVRQLQQAVCRDGCLGLLLTDRPAAAACLANRKAGIRAALATDVKTM